MKNIRKIAKLACFLLIMISVNVSMAALLVTDPGGDDVGFLDTLESRITHTVLNATFDPPGNKEVQWVKSILGDDYCLDYKIEDENVVQGNWEAIVGNTDYYAFDISSYGASPDYFVIKTGNIGSPGGDYILFQNNDEKSWLVLDVSPILGSATGTYPNFGKFSHISAYRVCPVPEPSSYALMLIGLLGLAVYRRNRTK